MKKIEEKINNLRNELRNLEKHYYQGNSIERDDVYDFKLRELFSLEKRYPEFSDSNSPTQRVGFYMDSEIRRKHEVPMLSLSNAFNKEDIENFFEHCEKDVGPLEYILEPKIDGTSISLIYENGYLKHALSRGNGEEGEELLKKILNISSIPIYISKIPEKLTVRGEIYIDKSDFEALKNSGEKEFANHRNFVAGCLRLKKSEELLDKRLKFVAYQILYPEKINLYRQSDVINSLKKWGFNSHSNVIVLSNKEEIFSHINFFFHEKNSSNIPFDGLVLKVNNLTILDDIGYTSKFPKWAIAYKYPTQVKETKLLNIFPSVGRTGKIAYTAEVDPVILDGSVVKHATLHNANYIMDLDLRIGDYVGIYKSGEIIPKILGCIKEKRCPNSVR